MASNNLFFNAPQTLTGENYQIWALKMKSYLEAYDLWEVVKEDKPIEPLPENSTPAQIKVHSEEKPKRHKAKIVIQILLLIQCFLKLLHVKQQKKLGKNLKRSIKEVNKAEKIKRDFESLRMQEGETITQYSDIIVLIVNRIRLLDKNFKDNRIVEKILVTIPERFESKISALEESKDLSTISLAELISALQAHEQRRAFRQDKVLEAVSSRYQLSLLTVIPLQFRCSLGGLKLGLSFVRLSLNLE
ncbi:uncharacterized protein LOC132035051 [Lycium ferocissimum]|uniref:uncharacterized protein LOC132035051 n=1 Tax=Lycium ferocissimum TaxID=112874 RepID=UPI002816916A|nr:uncharacterized protein LOC132035051 [Lycium ferocissimum]